MFYDDEDMIDCHKTIWISMRINQKKVPPDAERSVPKIIFRDWRRVQTRSDEEYLTLQERVSNWRKFRVIARAEENSAHILERPGGITSQHVVPFLSKVSA
jgi:hypothetical protein